MKELYNLGISDTTLKCMIEINPEILEMSNNEINDKKDILKRINCTDREILNIISSNALMLNRTNSGLIDLINYLKELGFDNLNILFDSNPYILNLEPFEIKRYIDDRLNDGESIEDIIDELDSNPYLFNEL